MGRYAVRLDDISFSYEDHRVIRNLSLGAESGEHIGIVGESGCGKSTVLKILAGLYEPDCGKIMIAGERSPEKIRRRTAFVMQRSSLFPLSIRDNITCGHHIPEEKVWAACENASLANWIEKLPKGLDTYVGERGGQVSGGQAQRIQIARALCKDAPVVLLDEPTSALDQDTGYSVLEALNRLMVGRTVIHVTHHRETLDESYAVYRMKGENWCMSDLGKLLKRMGIRRKYLFLLLLRAPFDAFRTWMLANLLRSVWGCVETRDSASLLKICVGYGLLCAMLFLYNGIVWSSYAAFAAKAEAWLQEELLGKILSLPLKRIESRLGGEWITKWNSDIHGAFLMMNGALNLPHLAVSVVNTLLSSFLLFRSSPLLLGATWMFIFPQLLINDKIVLEAVPQLKEKSQNAMAESTSSIKPLIAEAETILLYDAGALMMKNCEEYSRRLLEVNMKMHVRKAFGNMGLSLLWIGGYLTLLLAGYGLIEKGTMAFSDVVYCFQARGGVLAGTLMFVTCFNNLKVNSVCVKRIKDTLEE